MTSNAGRSAEDLYGQAKSGKFSMTDEAAQRMGNRYKQYAQELEELIEIADRLQYVHGFGDFPSGHDLTAGFIEKAVKLREELTAHIEAAYKTEAAHLQAGKLFNQADEAFSQSLKFMEKQVGEA